jgi:hypothetical protein
MTKNKNTQAVIHIKQVIGLSGLASGCFYGLSELLDKQGEIVGVGFATIVTVAFVTWAINK